MYPGLYPSILLLQTSILHQQACREPLADFDGTSFHDSELEDLRHVGDSQLADSGQGLRSQSSIRANGPQGSRPRAFVPGSGWVDAEQGAHRLRTAFHACAR